MYYLVQHYLRYTAPVYWIIGLAGGALVYALWRRLTA
jgi:hypothetical protein